MNLLLTWFFCLSKQFPSELLVSIHSFKASPIQHGVHFVNYAPNNIHQTMVTFRNENTKWRWPRLQNGSPQPMGDLQARGNKPVSFDVRVTKWPNRETTQKVHSVWYNLGCLGRAARFNCLTPIQKLAARPAQLSSVHAVIQLILHQGSQTLMASCTTEQLSEEWTGHHLQCHIQILTNGSMTC